MKITEKKLRKIIRQVILENVQNKPIGELKDFISDIMTQLKMDLETCEPHLCLTTVNMSISRMSDEWNQYGGNQVGFFVKDCEFGREMDRIQSMLVKDRMMPLDLLMREIDHAEGVLDSCNFPELSGMEQGTFYTRA